MPEWTKVDRVVLVALFALAAGLLFVGLGERALWQDEAETALLARSVLAEGVPTAHDGRNWISQEGGQEFSPPDHRWFWTPWLQHYVAAGSFLLLGAGTFAARLPFALFALGCVYLVYRLTLEASRDRRAALIAVALLTTSVPFLLHARQARYYAAAAFFLSGLVLAYGRVLDGRPRAWLAVVVAATGLFHSHYVLFAGAAAGLGIHYGVLCRDRAAGVALAKAAVVVLGLAAPFAVRFALHASGQALPGLGQSLGSLGDAAFHFNRYIFPLALLLVLGLVLAIDRDAAPEDALPLARVWPHVFVVVFSVLLLVAAMPWFFFRYYVALIPICVVLQAVVVSRVFRWRTAVGWVVLLVLCLTDVLPRAFPLSQRIPPGSVRHLVTGDEDPARVVGAWARFVPMAGYLYELAHERTGPVEAAARYLEANAHPDDVVIATYGDLPLQFYTGLKVVGGLSGEDPAAYAQAEWLFVRAHTHRAGDRRLKQFIVEHVDLSLYDAVGLSVADVPYENRPDPTYHKFRSPEGGLPEARLLRRRGSGGGG